MSKKRVYVSIHATQEEYINKEAARLGVTVNNIISRAINTYRYIEEEAIAKNSKVLIEAPDKSVRVVEFI